MATEFGGSEDTTDGVDGGFFDNSIFGDKSAFAKGFAGCIYLAGIFGGRFGYEDPVAHSAISREGHAGEILFSM